MPAWIERSCIRISSAESTDVLPLLIECFGLPCSLLDVQGEHRANHSGWRAKAQDRHTTHAAPAIERSRTEIGRDSRAPRQAAMRGGIRQDRRPRVRPRADLAKGETEPIAGDCVDRARSVTDKRDVPATTARNRREAVTPPRTEPVGCTQLPPVPGNARAHSPVSAADPQMRATHISRGATGRVELETVSPRESRRSRSTERRLGTVRRKPNRWVSRQRRSERPTGARANRPRPRR